MGAISTAVTFIPPIVARVFSAGDVEFWTTFIVVSLPIVLLLGLIFLPFREAHKLYREKFAECESLKISDEARAAKAQLSVQIASLIHRGREIQGFKNFDHHNYRQALQIKEEWRSQAREFIHRYSPIGINHMEKTEFHSTGWETVCNDIDNDIELLLAVERQL
jgi:biopolymer transport protein ExbB/TolQ